MSQFTPKQIISDIPIVENTDILVYNPLEVFVDRVHEKEICHTAIITDLLNPYGKHQMGTLFLSSFLNSLKINCNDLSLNEIEIKRERKIKSSLPNMDERSIDICLQIKTGENKYAIIVENKINNADERIEQLLDYKKGLEEEGYKVIKTVCLQGSSRKNIGADINITPKKLSSIWKPLIPDTAYGLKAYLTLLENMDKKTDLLKNANEFLELDDNEIKTIRTIALSFNEIAHPIFIRIINELKKRKELDFKPVRKGLNTGHIYNINRNTCLQLWNEEEYRDGSNRGFWIEVWFYDFNRFEIWIAQDKDSTNDLDLNTYKKSEEHLWYYVDKNVNRILNDGKEAKKFDFPNRDNFEEMIIYIYIGFV